VNTEPRHRRLLHHTHDARKRPPAIPTPPLADRIAARPADAQAKVAALVDALERRTRAGIPHPIAGTPTGDLPFVGMGADRDDRADGTAWVRRLRREAWGCR
jgi:hypothetical protein